MAYASASSLISAPFKRSSDIDLIKPLKAYIFNSFSKEQADAQKDALEELQNLRNKVLNKLSDKHESAIQLLCKYHDQLVALETKIPVTENGARINFKWTDAFGKESFFAGKSSVKIATGAYERICVLYSLGALYSACASTQNLTDDKGLQTAVKYFRQAAGIFNFLRINAAATLQQEATSDLNPDVLNGLTSLMLAQAQDCVYMKVSMDKKTDAVVAKVAAYAGDLYGEAHKAMNLHSIKDVWPREWLSYASGKQAGFQALSEFHQGKACGAEKKFGEEIARYKLALEMFNKSSQVSGSQFQFRDCLTRTQRSLESAEKDNNLIYFDKIPKDLQPVGRAQIAKEIEPTFPLMATEKLNDLFNRLVPMAVHQALGNFDARRAELVNMERARLREASDMLTSVMASLNLPASLEDTGSGNALPSSIIEKNQKVRDAGGVGSITAMLSNLPDLMHRNKEILAEAIRQMDEEQSSDDRLRQQFGERWVRTPSTKLTESLRAEAAKFTQILTNAENADGTVKQRFNDHKKGMEMLSKPESELQGLLPKGGNVSGGNQNAKEALKGLCEKVETLKRDREALDALINEANSEDMPALFSKALAESGAIDEESLSAEHLNRIFAPIRENVSQSIAEQESLLCSVQQKNNEWLGNATGGGGNERQAVLSELAAAFDNFKQLKDNLEEGSKFYNDLTEILLRYQTKVQDFCFARKTEKDELMKDLQSNIVAQKKESAPSAPNYQTQSEPARVPPPRPPPPQQPAEPTPPVPAPRSSHLHSPSQQPQQTPETTNEPPSAPPPVAAPQAAPPAPYAPYGAPQPGGMPLPYPQAPYGMPYPQAPPHYPSYPGYSANYAAPPPPQGYYMTPTAPYGQYPQQGAPYGYPQYPQNQQWPPRQ